VRCGAPRQGVNPQGVQVVSFKQPSSQELDHTYLWRISNALYERGRIGIFNRSQYEEVVALRVNPECDNVMWSGHTATGTDREAIMEHNRLVADDFGYVGTIVPVRDGVMAALRVK
jgi:polyphosphate kinase 2 (PPK2 family)